MSFKNLIYRLMCKVRDELGIDNLLYLCGFSASVLGGYAIAKALGPATYRYIEESQAVRVDNPLLMAGLGIGLNVIGIASPCLADYLSFRKSPLERYNERLKSELISGLTEDQLEEKLGRKSKANI